MARIAGINIPMNKHVSIGLTHIFGIGRSRALEILQGAGITPTTKVKDLTDAEVAAIRSQLAKKAVFRQNRACRQIRDGICTICAPAMSAIEVGSMLSG